VGSGVVLPGRYVGSSVGFALGSREGELVGLAVLAPDT